MVNDDRITGPKYIQAGIDFSQAIERKFGRFSIDFRIVFIHLQNPSRYFLFIVTQSSIHKFQALYCLFTYSQRGPEFFGLQFDLNQSTQPIPSLPDKVQAP